MVATVLWPRVPGRCFTSSLQHFPSVTYCAFSSTSTGSSSSLSSSITSSSSSSSSVISARRHALASLFLATTAACILPVPCTLAAPVSPVAEEPDLPRFTNTDSGIRIQDVLEGTGVAAKEGDLVEFNYVCRRSNGYFVYSTINQFSGEGSPVTLPLGGSEMIAGLQRVLLGMKPGGKRRAVIPPAAGYITTELEPKPKGFGPRRSLFSHAGEPLLFEVQLLKIK